MKAYPCSVLVLASLGSLLLSPLSAAPKDLSPYAFPTSYVEQCGQRVVERGDTTLSVVCRLGFPHRKLSRDVWMYRGYHPRVPLREDRGCDTLIITFVDDRVTSMRIANRRAVGVIAARALAGREATFLAER